MANFNQAPILSFDKPKEKSKVFYNLPQDITDVIFSELGNSSAQIRIMIVLIGTKPGFSISEKWMLERTGLTHSSYISARSALCKKGWLTLDKNSKNLRVNFNEIVKGSYHTTS